MAQYDLIIRGGTIVDGTGSPSFTGDVAVKDGLITAVGRITGTATEEIDAAGKVVTLREGIETELGKKIQRQIKDSKLKVQAALQDKQVRITGKSRDDLQDAIALVKKGEHDLPLQFTNFRD